MNISRALPACLMLRCVPYAPCAGKALTAVSRDQVVIATKWGPMFDKSGIKHTQTRQYARQACEGALKRLGTNYIDLFTLRGPIQPGTDIADLMQELKVTTCNALGSCSVVLLSKTACRHAGEPGYLDWAVFLVDYS
eukprot:GHRR01024972.1.p1 GENE.GHRR01024972.1~~GHRR01024972.1.p1  ORF type:complete len:137 (+),score=21.18 GHRR01024972.1:1161-1571(+)